jgi:hypothetical protein
MFDLSSKFNTFYDSYVVLPQADQDELHNKKNINVQRLKDGLKEYNEEHNTSYSVVDTCVQGSVAMSTVVQNEENDYDIDVAVVFNKSALGDKGAQATRYMVANALKRKTKQFNAEPEVKTSCVRVKYADGYHIDFAVYRRSWDTNNERWKYEHAGSDWTERELKGLTEWFKTQNDASSGKLRRVVRLSKMFCKSRDSWKNMPSGLLQTVLCDEKLQSSHSRIDELFYYTMKEIVERIEDDNTVSAPVDNGRDLTPRKSDLQRMTNWKNRLKSKLEDLDILFKDDCSEDDALQAWYGFFNHDYWSEQKSSETSSYSLSTIQKSAIKSFADNEQFIEDMFPVNLCHTVNVTCTVSGDGWRPKPIREFLSMLQRFLPHNFEIRCSVASTTASYPYDVYWKVKNVGPEAERRNQLRGQIVNKGNSIVEHTNFYGNHYIECYIVKSGYCVAKKRIEVPIGRR